MKLKDETKILETMGKLTGPTLRWYQENLRSFTKWDDAEKALRDRFKEFTSGSQLMHEFFQLYQDENQSITSFYENVIRKYRKARQFITEQQVITVVRFISFYSKYIFNVNQKQEAFLFYQQKQKKFTTTTFIHFSINRKR
ncbi:unnamed protein product [Rotaria magnacalcarata]|uniref:Retrotransposon gag domain-containing protein n=1 Tax=Rotaria magnacalcarata TaxID=392030 RepID=A0A816M5J1_9BILA|nr:unnamed protein product [Rotaria magnacalcarata]CAF4196597.1 unnamed protein product [Rotaria magnacalcarata]